MTIYCRLFYFIMTYNHPYSKTIIKQLETSCFFLITNFITLVYSTPVLKQNSIFLPLLFQLLCLQKLEIFATLVCVTVTKYL